MLERLEAMRLNPPKDVVLVWQRDAAENKYVVLGGEHCSKALIRRREKLSGRGLPLYAAFKVVLDLFLKLKLRTFVLILCCKKKLRTTVFKFFVYS